ncbi:hypothetical protein QCA50_005474 [Cerrena zonata]|uniref:Alcohol dehydrogenase n=1 Tax=Cerrena zonata TaxID=2478898 RepID=A0AAW0GJW2_9APHY
MTHPESFKAFAFPERHGKLQKITLPWKDPKDGEVVVKVLACGVCGSDEFLEEGHFGATYPRIPGHEIVGDIVQISPTVTQWKVANSLMELREMADTQEYVTLRAEVLVNLPADTDPAEVAPLLCAGVTVFNALRHMDYGPGDLVAVQGIGGLGHLAIQYARKMGLRPVAISTSPSKKDLALRLGAEAFLDSSKEDIGKALT